MRKRFREMPKYYQEEFIKDKDKLQFKLFQDKNFIRSLLFAVEKNMITYKDDPKLNINNYIDLSKKQVTARGIDIFNRYLELIEEIKLEKVPVYEKYKDDLVFFLSKYDFDYKMREKIKAKRLTMKKRH